MSHQIICDVINSFTKQIPNEKQTTITIVQALCYGCHKHIIEGDVRHITNINGVPCLFVLSGERTKRLYKIFDNQKLKAQVGAFIRVCVVPEIAPDLRISYVSHKIQNPDKFFDMNGEPFQISLDDFGNEDWKEGVQKIALSRCRAFRSRSGVVGLNYTVAN